MRLVRPIIYCMLLFTYSTTITAQTDARRCTVKSIIGSVKIQRGAAKNWIDARPNMPLKQNDVIRTFIESEAELETSEGTLLKAGENSTIEFAAFFSSGELQNIKIKILNGSLMSNVKKLTHTKSTFEFETPAATAATRGTIAGFNVNGENTLVKIYEGRALVAPRGSKNSVEMNDNQMTLVSNGQKEVRVETLDEKAVVPPLKNSGTTTCSPKSSGPLNTLTHQ
jgi:hypothetical protein